MEATLTTLAQVFVSPLVGTVSDHYGTAILEKIGLTWDVNEEMEKLSDILLTAQEVLEDDEDKQVTNKPLCNWLRKLKDIAYDVEDILDECATEAILDPESTGITNRAAMVERIKQLIDTFDRITKQRSEFNLNNRNSATRALQYRVDPRRETSSFPTEPTFYGREEEKNDIVNLLVSNINVKDLAIYAIVGMGGLGKTTLAQMVYNDNMVKSCFHIRRWVCVSENFEVKSLIEDIIQSPSNEVQRLQTLDQLQRHLQEELRGKRFLLVLDDVWNEDQTRWEKLKSSLTCGAKGSSIVVTTRSDKVASLMGFSNVCHPKILSDEDCFSLFKHHAFVEGEGEHHPNLESIGKQIVKKCGGVPLAAKALGSLLRSEHEENMWLFVKDNRLWDLSQDNDDSILPALRLSYKHLPLHLRQCFAYCSIFPKDYIMKKDQLIQLWMANGFFPQKGSMELEDIGNGVFNELLRRSLFQETKRDINGNVVACKMHDLVHDLACSIARDECFSVVIIGDEELVFGGSNTARHLTLDYKTPFSSNFTLPMSFSFLRSLFRILPSFYFGAASFPPPSNFSNFIHLRVLDLSGTGLKTLPESIGELKLLRYLDLSNNYHIALLPDEDFDNLRNLQTLKLRNCDKLEMLPGNMRKLTNLRHLDITGSTRKMVKMPDGMGQLKCLHMLSNFIVSEESGCGVGELRGLDHLGRRLTITGLGKVRDPKDAENAELDKKKNIRYLQLDWSNDSGRVPVQTVQQTDGRVHAKLIAEALRPHPNIEKLDFHSYGGSDFPSWMNSSGFSRLVEISLSGCLNCKSVPALGLLPRLKVLKISDNRSVKCIGNEFYYSLEEERTTQGMVLFPSLEQLELSRMYCLKEWKGWSSSKIKKEEEEAQVSIFPVLERLKIEDCPKLRTFPSLRFSIQLLELHKCSKKIFERSLENLPHISHLIIRDFPNRKIVLPNLVALQRLKIHYCIGLKYLNMGLQRLTNLHNLEIYNCPELELLPDDLQNLVSLESLHLEGLDKLSAVPEVGSSTLNTISFKRCHRLRNLPDWITNQRFLQSLNLQDSNQLKFLPEGFQHLTSLRNLRITGCHPELHRRCQKNTGEDWHKIAHIPNLIRRY